MKALVRYAIVGLLIVAGLVLVFGSLLDAEGRRGVLVGGLIAWSTQVALFGLLLGAVGDPRRFVLTWGAGVLGRMAVVGGVGLIASQLSGSDPAPILLSTIGFIFVLLLLEAVFMRRVQLSPRVAR